MLLRDITGSCETIDDEVKKISSRRPKHLHWDALKRLRTHRRIHCTRTSTTAQGSTAQALAPARPGLEEKCFEARPKKTIAVYSLCAPRSPALYNTQRTTQRARFPNTYRVRRPTWLDNPRQQLGNHPKFSFHLSIELFWCNLGWHGNGLWGFPTGLPAPPHGFFFKLRPERRTSVPLRMDLH